MNSPFPGMDPYLEAHWRDVHARLILYACDQLEPQLPPNLIARVEERVVVEPDEGAERAIYPDVRVVEHSGETGTAVAVESEVTVTEPVIVHYDAEPATETFLEIREAGGKQRLITVLEVLSPSNKLAGENQQQYRQKQSELRRAAVTLVEIDLLRSGKRVLSVPVSRIPRRARTTYQVCVRRGWQPHTYEVYPVHLRRRLPIIKVPLRERDAEAKLDLQALVDEVYRKGRYFTTIDYEEPPEPPLAEPDRAWARGLLRPPKKRAT